MKEEILDLMLLNGAYECGESAEVIANIITDFIEWAATTHIKLHQVWCGLYIDQRNQANWKTTEELFQFWNTNIKNK